MEYNSFYGGRRGASFVIVKRFKTINIPSDNIIENSLKLENKEFNDITKEQWLNENCMIYCFKQGNNYKTVNYDEYVIIDTENKNNKDNGKIYRRGYNFNNDEGGAIYEGQIVGPGGPAPHTVMTTIANVKDVAEEDGNTYMKSEGQYKPTENLVPGAKGTETNRIFDDTTDSIQWAATSIRDINSLESTVYVGFKFPYTIIDYDAKSVSPYYNRDSQTASFDNMHLAERIDDKTHPFYEKWRISIPRGIKGDSLANFKVLSGADIDSLIKSGKMNTYKGYIDDIEKNRHILVYNIRNYNKDNAGEEEKYIYISPYNIISGMSIQENGTISFSYTYNDTQTFPQFFKWIDTISLNPENGHFEITYNKTDSNGNKIKYETDLDWVNGIELSNNGTLTIKHSHEEDEVLSNKIKWINNMSINTGSEEGTGNQKIKVVYNDGISADIGNPLNYIMRTAISSDYHLLILHSDPSKRAAIVASDKNYTYDGRNDWQDMGSIKDNDGILIGLNYSIEDNPDLENITSAINYFNTQFPEGITTPGLEGKIITVQNLSEKTSLLYAFDYGLKSDSTYKGWYCLGDIGSASTSISSIAGSLTDETTLELAERLPENSLWFIVEE